ncbi:tetratricopeptide repeat protein [Prevotella pectinovora]|uniref:tetratricopeptide repeat protein n=1 Tax=Prevotella pectinovora TaxID=1602169 RepID=UPI0005B70876|nr:tetratricopeptide repeat protein [Prevotella pectinovora]KIP62246.1 tetratricopeptide repeat protein [Prevotella pectinovora]
MQKNVVLFMSAAALLALSSCSSKLGALSADNFSVNPNPLETEAGKVPTTINGKFPEKYMKKKAVVTVTPELRYADGKTAKGNGATFQGEKVAGNNQTIQYKVGGNYTMNTSFDYVPEMQKSDLYLTFDAYVGKKKVNVPEVKVATGVISTSEFYKKTLASDGACIAPDSFQRVKAQKQEAEIKFLINQANLRKSEMKNNSVKEFVQMLKKINRDKEGLNIKNVEVAAYASPEGGVKFNDKLASKRQNTSEKYVKQTLKNTKVNTDVDARYTAQDWDGFQKLVAASNLQDKDVILRVLSMYQDPQEREQQIRNMSAGFRELADGILPELRRSRLIINYETIGRSDDQIKEQYNADPTKLSADELLYAAALEDNADKKEAIYKKTAEIYPNDNRAFNNVAALEFAKGNNDAAKEYLAKAVNAKSDAAEANANKGLVALLEGNTAEAQNHIAKATGANDLNKALGALNIANGKYAQAEQNFNGVNSNTAALAQILNKNYAGAISTLNGVKNKTGVTDYLLAIANARQGNNDAASSYLKSALQKDPSLASYAANDLELINVSK